MILELYAIYDKKLGEFLPPFCCKNESDAVRMCSNLVNHSDSLMLKFPDDYVCHFIGTFDTVSRDIVCSFDVSDKKEVSIEFNTLVKDETIKYKDVLNKISNSTGVIDSKLLLLSDKINKLDSLYIDYQSKLKALDEKTDNFNKKSVDVPHFLPTNNTPAYSRKSILDKLFH